MDKQLQDELGAKLREEQTRLRKELGRFATKVPAGKDNFQSTFPEYGSSEDENAAEVTEFENRLGLESDLETSLKAVDHALERMQQGTYGACEVCSKPIDPERLKASPSVTKCIEHQAATT